MSENMHDLSGWIETTCLVADVIRYGDHVSPSSSLTDPDGHYGTAVIYTEWAEKTTERAILRDYRWPDVACRHYVPAPIPSESPRESEKSNE